MSSQVKTPPVKHIAQLAKLTLTDTQLQAYAAGFTNVLNLMNQINQLDLSDAQSTSRVTEEENVFRADEVQPSLTQEEAVSNAKENMDGYFVAPYVVEEWDA